MGSFFKRGHDRVAESAVIAVDYGSVAGCLKRHGFGTGGRNASAELEAHRRKGQGS